MTIIHSFRRFHDEWAQKRVIFGAGKEEMPAHEKTEAENIAARIKEKTGEFPKDEKRSDKIKGKIKILEKEIAELKSKVAPLGKKAKEELDAFLKAEVHAGTVDQYLDTELKKVKESNEQRGLEILRTFDKKLDLLVYKVDLRKEFATAFEGTNLSMEQKKKIGDHFEFQLGQKNTALENPLSTVDEAGKKNFKSAKDIERVLQEMIRYVKVFDRCQKKDCHDWNKTTFTPEVDMAYPTEPGKDPMVFRHWEKNDKIYSIDNIHARIQMFDPARELKGSNDWTYCDEVSDLNKSPEYNQKINRPQILAHAAKIDDNLIEDAIEAYKLTHSGNEPSSSEKKTMTQKQLEKMLEKEKKERMFIKGSDRRTKDDESAQTAFNSKQQKFISTWEGKNRDDPGQAGSEVQPALDMRGDHLGAIGKAAEMKKDAEKSPTETVVKSEVTEKDGKPKLEQLKTTATAHQEALKKSQESIVEFARSVKKTRESYEHERHWFMGYFRENKTTDAEYLGTIMNFRTAMEQSEALGKRFEKDVQAEADKLSPDFKKIVDALAFYRASRNGVEEDKYVEEFKEKFVGDNPESEILRNALFAKLKRESVDALLDKQQGARRIFASLSAYYAYKPVNGQIVKDDTAGEGARKFVEELGKKLEEKKDAPDFKSILDDMVKDNPSPQAMVADIRSVLRAEPWNAQSIEKQLAKQIEGFQEKKPPPLVKLQMIGELLEGSDFVKHDSNIMKYHEKLIECLQSGQAKTLSEAMHAANKYFSIDERQQNYYKPWEWAFTIGKGESNIQNGKGGILSSGGLDTEEFLGGTMSDMQLASGRAYCDRFVMDENNNEEEKYKGRSMLLALADPIIKKYTEDDKGKKLPEIEALHLDMVKTRFMDEHLLEEYQRMSSDEMRKSIAEKIKAQHGSTPDDLDVLVEKSMMASVQLRLEQMGMDEANRLLLTYLIEKKNIISRDFRSFNSEEDNQLAALFRLKESYGIQGESSDESRGKTRAFVKQAAVEAPIIFFSGSVGRLVMGGLKKAGMEGIKLAIKERAKREFLKQGGKLLAAEVGEAIVFTELNAMLESGVNGGDYFESWRKGGMEGRLKMYTKNLVMLQTLKAVSGTYSSTIGKEMTEASRMSRGATGQLGLGAANYTLGLAAEVAGFQASAYVTEGQIGHWDEALETVIALRLGNVLSHGEGSSSKDLQQWSLGKLKLKERKAKPLPLYRGPKISEPSVADEALERYFQERDAEVPGKVAEAPKKSGNKNREYIKNNSGQTVEFGGEEYKVGDRYLYETKDGTVLVEVVRISEGKKGKKLILNGNDGKSYEVNERNHLEKLSPVEFTDAELQRMRERERENAELERNPTDQNWKDAMYFIKSGDRITTETGEKYIVLKTPPHWLIVEGSMGTVKIPRSDLMRGEYKKIERRKIKNPAFEPASDADIYEDAIYKRTRLKNYDPHYHPETPAKAEEPPLEHSRRDQEQQKKIADLEKQYKEKGIIEGGIVDGFFDGGRLVMEVPVGTDPNVAREQWAAQYAKESEKKNWR